MARHAKKGLGRLEARRKAFDALRADVQRACKRPGSTNARKGIRGGKS